jgi:hypothetical protein
LFAQRVTASFIVERKMTAGGGAYCGDYLAAHQSGWGTEQKRMVCIVKHVNKKQFEPLILLSARTR